MRESPLFARSAPRTLIRIPTAATSLLQRSPFQRQTGGLPRWDCPANIRNATLATLLLVLAACGPPTPDSFYLPMTDGTELAVDVWLPRAAQRGSQVPSILSLSRYWRDYQLPGVFPVGFATFQNAIAWLYDAGYAVVVVDVRGTGASFGVSTAPWSPAEIADFPALVDWITRQPWSNGRVGSTGVSYEAVTADWLAAVNHPAVKAVLPAYGYSDIYRDVSHPGGLFNERFVHAWGDVVARMDRNDPAFLDIVAAANPRGLLSVFSDVLSAVVLGVQPIAGAVQRLSDAVAQHAENPNVFEAARQIEFRDDLFVDVSVDDVSPLCGPPTTNRTAAIERVVGWHDAGTVRGALSSFNTLVTPYHVVIIAPENHTGNFRADPYDLGPPPRLDEGEVTSAVWEALPFLDTWLTPETRATPADPDRPSHCVRYYTYVERVWKESPVWPPPGFELQRWYFTAHSQLSRSAPVGATGEDIYAVDFEATTGPENRWFSGLSGVPVCYPDRAAQDRRLLVYDSPALDQDYELTGHPVVSLQVISTHDDGAFLVYLEDVAPDGKVVYLTEGALRAIHRRVSAQPPPVALFGPHHTFRRADAWPLVPGEVAELTFDLLPISTIVRKDHRLRVALAGHDAGTFSRYPAEGTPVLRFQRNAAHACWIDIPLKPRGDLGPRSDAPPLKPLWKLGLCPLTSAVLLASCFSACWRRARWR